MFGEYRMKEKIMESDKPEFIVYRTKKGNKMISLSEENIKWIEENNINLSQSVNNMIEYNKMLIHKLKKKKKIS
jgi:hypothetical protein